MRHVKEISNFTIINGAETCVGGDSRRRRVISNWFRSQEMAAGNFPSKGRSLSGNGTLEAVIGDSISQTMYSPDQSAIHRPIRSTG